LDRNAATKSSKASRCFAGQKRRSEFSNEGPAWLSDEITRYRSVRAFSLSDPFTGAAVVTFVLLSRALTR
jgi:hypothetical protein